MSKPTENNTQMLQINPVVARKFDCKLCEKSFTGIESQTEHFKSKKHINKEAERNQQVVNLKEVRDIQEQINPADEKKFECKICEKSFTGIESQQEHFLSKKHLKNELKNKSISEE